MHALLGLLLLLLMLSLGCTQTKTASADEPRALSRLTWNYLSPAPESFVIQRRIEGHAWEDVATLPGISGENLTWSDTSLIPGPTEIVAHYRVFAVIGNQRSEPTTRVTTTIPPVPPPPVFPEGSACVVTNITSTAVTITCPLAPASKARR